jgi:hypothetical protein
MLPSPSLGPPLLSASRSPAFGPCGIPDELVELDADDADDAGAEDDEADDAGAADDDAGAELVAEDEEPPPQPAAASATTRRPAQASRRSRLVLMSESP